MSLFGRLISRLIGNSNPESPSAVLPVAIAKPAVAQTSVAPLQDSVQPKRGAIPVPTNRGFVFTVSMTGLSSNGDSVSEGELAAASAQYEFVLDSDLPSLRASDQWWNEDVHKRRLHEGSDKALAWLEPFAPVSLVQALPLQSARTEWGPMQAAAIAKELRAVIRERRKAKQPHDELLRALYGACLLADFVKALRFEYVQPHQLARFVDIRAVQSTDLHYPAIGYQAVEALGKTDIKWLVAAFGEPAEHRPVAQALAPLIQGAVSRYCWEELRSSSSYGNDRADMQKWLAWQVGIRLQIEKDDAGRASDRLARFERDKIAVESLPQAWAATRQSFVVADLETTGLDSAVDDIIEFAAVRVSPQGAVLAEFAALVNIGRPVPPFIVGLTGISDADLQREGQALVDALDAFLLFVGAAPVFFHNAPFDQGFVNRACQSTNRKLANPVYDTLVMARAVWPDAESLKLRDLAWRVGAPEPTHRALSDARATLAVLLAARDAKGVDAPG